MHRHLVLLTIPAETLSWNILAENQNQPLNQLCSLAKDAACINTLKTDTSVVPRKKHFFQKFCKLLCTLSLQRLSLLLPKYSCVPGKLPILFGGLPRTWSTGRRQHAKVKLRCYFIVLLSAVIVMCPLIQVWKSNHTEKKGTWGRSPSPILPSGLIIHMVMRWRIGEHWAPVVTWIAFKP